MLKEVALSLGLGTTAFGGSAAHIAMMEQSRPAAAWLSINNSWHCWRNQPLSQDQLHRDGDTHRASESGCGRIWSWAVPASSRRDADRSGVGMGLCPFRIAAASCGVLYGIKPVITRCCFSGTRRLVPESGKKRSSSRLFNDWCRRGALVEDTLTVLFAPRYHRAVEWIAGRRRRPARDGPSRVFGSAWLRRLIARVPRPLRYVQYAGSTPVFRK